MFKKLAPVGQLLLALAHVRQEHPGALSGEEQRCSVAASRGSAVPIKKVLSGQRRAADGRRKIAHLPQAPVPSPHR